MTLQFYTRQSIAEVALYVTHAQDDSYTPQRVVVSASSSGLRQDLAEVRSIALSDEIAPEAWIRIPLHNPHGRGLQRYLRTACLQVSFPFMYSNGRDLHLRGLHVLGPVEEGEGAGTGGGGASLAAASAPAARWAPPQWVTPAMFAGAHVR